MQLNEKTSLKKHIAMRFLSAPEGIRRAAPQQRPTGALLPRGTQSAGHGLFKSPILLPHKIRAKQKEQYPIRCCSWCSKAIQIRTIFYNGLQWKNQRTAFNSFRKSDARRPMVFAISWWTSVVLVYNSLMVEVMGCMRIRLTGLYTASTTAASTTTTITARQPHGICHAAPK